MQKELSKYDVNFSLAGGRLWQEPTTLRRDPADPNAPIVELAVKRYGRFGNNIYQTLNAILIARGLRVPTVNLQGFAMHQATALDGWARIEIVEDAIEPSHGSSLAGNFYAPFGFENIFLDQDIGIVADLVRRSARSLYRDLVGKAFPSRSLALHFRGGDIFASDDVHRWYVQPPASYYLTAVDHALADDHYDCIELVCEDRSNPAIDVVEAGLAARKLAVNSRTSTLGADINRLLSARAIVASFGTFSEAAALISPNLSRYYCFRTINSQVDLHPFVQMRFGSIIKTNDVRCYVVDDLAYEYTTPKTWRNTPEQRAIIASYPSHHLRLYEDRIS